MASKNGQPVQAYAVPSDAGYGQQGGQQYPQAQPYAPPHPYQQPYQQQATAPTVVAQPYNGPTAQQAVPGHAANQPQIVVVHRHGGGGAVQHQPHSYCCLAWLSCLFCCCPIGLFAVYSSWNVRQKWQTNDFDGAYRASEMTKKLSLLAILVGLIWQISTAYVETTSSGDDDDNFSSPSPSPSPGGRGRW